VCVCVGGGAVVPRSSQQNRPKGTWCLRVEGEGGGREGGRGRGKGEREGGEDWKVCVCVGGGPIKRPQERPSKVSKAGREGQGVEAGCNRSIVKRCVCVGGGAR